ncbi:6-bladed beta-propeller [Geobacter benzoatilyticus]|uniref:6-bladed beta-propeller n=1 Tax=Geobacter benzoatilyticus TaxID=2815309 RepID=A0ABX7Q514_9BACT|nr:6-bladed beta-propeller [Geobacter benzoatilyticus]QSV46148.1 6-bladed beta-propeller [Geobacter benzoatilyticus]
MKAIRIISRLIILTALAALFAGCAGQQVQQQRYFWPPLPERPRLEWIGAYSSENDFPKEGFAAFLEKVAGGEDVMGLMKPVDIYSDGKGMVYVADPGLRGVVVFNMNERRVGFLGGDSSLSQFSIPVSVDGDSQGNIYVSDADRNRILVFDSNGAINRFIDTKTNVQRVGGITLDEKRQRILVVDTRGHQIVILDMQGNLITTIGKRGAEDGTFNFPVAVTLNHQGEIIVADAMNARIQIFDNDGKFLRKFGQRGDGPADFQIIKGVAVDSEDHIYVTEGKGHKLIIFGTNGEYLLTVGGLYSSITTGKQAPGGFVIPQGICIDDKDVVYVVDQLNRRFQVFQYISDAFLSRNPISGVQGGVVK